jgi:hypothetical protein
MRSQPILAVTELLLEDVLAYFARMIGLPHTRASQRFGLGPWRNIFDSQFDSQGDGLTATVRTRADCYRQIAQTVFWMQIEPLPKCAVKG